MPSYRTKPVKQKLRESCCYPADEKNDDNDQNTKLKIYTYSPHLVGISLPGSYLKLIGLLSLYITKLVPA
jgi:hypothetical protein